MSKEKTMRNKSMIIPFLVATILMAVVGTASAHRYDYEDWDTLRYNLISIDTDKTIVSSGDVFNVSIRASEFSDKILGAATIQIEYNPAIMDVENVTDGSLGHMTYSIKDGYYECFNDGCIIFSKILTVSAVSSSGVLSDATIANIRLRAVSKDERIGYLETTIQSFTDINGNTLVANIIDGAIAVKKPCQSSSSIKVVTPNGGETWPRGSTRLINWSKTGDSGAYVKIELLKAGVRISNITTSTPNGGSYSWTIPWLTLGSNYKIRITSTSNSAYTDTGDNNFTIGGINVISPNGGEGWLHGTTKTITWSSVGNPGSYVKIDLYKAGVFKQTIVSSTPNDGSHYWYIPTTQTLGTDYKIKITSTSNSAYYDWSNNYFRIY